MKSDGRPSQLRRLLLVDAAGAVLTAVITLGVLATGMIASGVPAPVWWALGGVAVGLAVQGGVALWRQPSPAPQLRRLAAANGTYAAMALFVIWTCRDSVTVAATTYVIAEALVLLALAAIEWRASRRSA